MHEQQAGAFAVPTGLGGQLDALEALVEQITAVDPTQLDGARAASASVRMHRALERLDAQRVGWLGAVHAAGWWAQQSARTFAHWIAATHRLPVGAARRLGNTATAVRTVLPSTGVAARAGELTSEHTRVMVSVAATSPARRQALNTLFARETGGPAPDASGPIETEQVRGEDLLIDLAQRASLGDFPTIVRRFAAVADPEADERGYRKAIEREYLDLAPTLDGYHLAGFLTQEHGQILTTALRAVTGVPAAGDTLSPARRRALALTGLATTMLDHGINAQPAPAGEDAPETPETPSAPGTSDAPGARKGPDAPGAHNGPDAASEPGALSAPAAPPASFAPPALGAPAAPSQPGVPEAPLAAPAPPAPATPGETCSHLDGAGRVRPHLVVHVSFSELERLLERVGPVPLTEDRSITAENLTRLLEATSSHYQDGTGPLPRQVLTRIAADSTLTRVVFGPDSQVLDVGRASRTFTGARRLAVIARDKCCIWPDCHAPPTICEVHHARVHWADGGATTPTNGALLCWYHHSEVDTKGIAMTWDNGWHFGPPGSYRPERIDTG